MYINSVLAKEAPTATTADAIHSVLNKHYTTLAQQIQGVAQGRWHLVINGPTGSGKTEFVKKVLGVYAERSPTFNSGSISAVGLFKLLYLNRAKGQVVVIDDSDSIFDSTEAVEVLKAALDTQPKKTVSWTKYSQALAKDGVPTEFTYEGRIIIITNRNMDRKEPKNKTDRMLMPLWSRVMYFAAGLPNRAWEVESIKMFYAAGEVRCFAEKKINATGQREIIDFVEEHKEELNDINFRLLSQLSDLYMAFGEDGSWKDHALMGLC
jgi:hypothetical protein